jgi:hypothetical protein
MTPEPSPVVVVISTTDGRTLPTVAVNACCSACAGWAVVDAGLAVVFAGPVAVVEDGTVDGALLPVHAARPAQARSADTATTHAAVLVNVVMRRPFSWLRPIQRRRETLVFNLEVPHVPPRTVLMGRVIVDPAGLISMPGVRLPGRSCEADQRATLVARDKRHDCRTEQRT